MHISGLSINPTQSTQTTTFQSMAMSAIPLLLIRATKIKKQKRKSQISARGEESKRLTLSLRALMNQTLCRQIVKLRASRQTVNDQENATKNHQNQKGVKRAKNGAKNQKAKRRKNVGDRKKDTMRKKMFGRYLFLSHRPNLHQHENDAELNGAYRIRMAYQIKRVQSGESWPLQNLHNLIRLLAAATVIETTVFAAFASIRETWCAVKAVPHRITQTAFGPECGRNGWISLKNGSVRVALRD